MHKTIYCISGLGADERVFDNLKLNGHELKYIPWLQPHKKEKIQHYASRMAASIKHELPILLGVSFGGMVGIEIAKQIQLKKLIIISSIKSTGELPRWMKVAGKIRLNKVLPTKSYKFTEKIDNARLGVSTEEEKIMVRAYRKKADPVYLEWAIHQVLNWKNEWQPDNIFHIHGDKDKIFPVKKLTPTHIIKDGTHMMVYNRAKEVGDCIEQVLRRK
jgi:pimeloyl-ACP methyl ester carboxylesterase